MPRCRAGLRHPAIGRADVHLPRGQRVLLAERHEGRGEDPLGAHRSSGETKATRWGGERRYENRRICCETVFSDAVSSTDTCLNARAKLQVVLALPRSIHILAPRLRMLVGSASARFARPISVASVGAKPGTRLPALDRSDAQYTRARSRPFPSRSCRGTRSPRRAARPRRARRRGGGGPSRRRRGPPARRCFASSAREEDVRVTLTATTRGGVRIARSCG